ncbi:hypothetical protein RKD41_000119 [Streptomyces tendae]
MNSTTELMPGTADATKSTIDLSGCHRGHGGHVAPKCCG